MTSAVSVSDLTRPETSRAFALRRRFAGSFAHDGTTWMLAGSLIAGMGAYVFQVVGARALGSAAYAAISVLWTVQYLLSSVVFTAVESYVVRSVTIDGGHLDRLRRSSTPLLATLGALTFGLGVAAWLFRDRIFPGNEQLAVVVPALVLTYGSFVTVRGTLAARGRFKAYGGVTAMESMLRLACAGLVLLTVSNPETLAWTLPAGALGATVWGLLVRRRDERLDPLRREMALPVTAGRFLLYTTAANGMAQFLLAGGPLLLVALGAPTTDITLLFITVTAARVPLVIVQGGLLSRLLPPATRMADEDPERLARTGRKLAVIVFVTAGVAALVARGIGPQLLSLLFGANIRPAPLVVTAVAAGVVLATGASLLNQLVIGSGRERALLVPWSAAMACAVVTMTVSPGAALDRVCLAFVVGEVVATFLLARRVIRPVGRT